VYKKQPNPRFLRFSTHSSTPSIIPRSFAPIEMFASKQSRVASLFFTLLLVLPKVQAQLNLLPALQSLDPNQLHQVVQGIMRTQAVGASGGAQANSRDAWDNIQQSGEQYEPAGFNRGGTVWTRAQAAHDFLGKPDTEGPSGGFKGKDIPTRPANNVDTQTQLDQALKVIGLINGLIATVPGVQAGNDMTLTGDGPEGAGAGQDNNLRVKMTPGGNWRASS